MNRQKEMKALRLKHRAQNAKGPSEEHERVLQELLDVQQQRDSDALLGHTLREMAAGLHANDELADIQWAKAVLGRLQKETEG